MNITVPMDDERFPPGSTLEFSRTHRVWTRTPYADGYAPVNEISSYIDASVMYGSSKKDADFLREWRGGQLRMGPGNLLPVRKDGFFVSGEGRVNENGGLTAMHTLLTSSGTRMCA